jgi:hypothetical protein
MLCELECEVVGRDERKEGEKEAGDLTSVLKRTRDVTLFQTSVEEMVPLLTSHLSIALSANLCK